MENDYRSRIELLTKSLESLTQQNRELSKAANDKIAENDDVLKENASLKQLVESKVRELNKIKIDWKEASNRMGTLQTENEKLSQFIQSNEAGHVHLSREIEELRKHNEKLYRDVEKLTEIISENDRYKQLLEEQLGLQSETIKQVCGVQLSVI
jgi:chromosome segregation ATPase